MLRPAFSTLIIAIALFSLTACEPLPGPEKSIEVAVQGSHMGRLSHNGSRAVIGSINHGGSLWQVLKEERLYDWNHSEEKSTLVAAAFSPEGDWAMTTDSHSLVLWKVDSGEAFRFWTAPGEVLSLALAPNGEYALLGMADHSAVIFDSKRGGVKRRFNHSGRVRSVDLSADGKLALTGSEDRTSVLWNVASGKSMQSMQHEEDVQLVRLSKNGDRALSAAKYDKAVVWNTQTGKAIGEIPLSAEKIKRGLRFSAARFSSSGRYLLVGRPDQRVQLWDTKTMKTLAEWEVLKRDAWKPTSAAIQDVAFASAKRTYYAIASNGFIHQLKRP
ncbi:WD40 repeat domain-containing protein [Pseudoteredinibacter isoporae]|uniref:WD40 repeat protein n=1 Tax=Pseudoteredinibacter isoporae TaxID=570281 RepID=A0A7X0MW34_9GAMM|nr:hypothetical protein [Pseudoteredinibacter isoporae]MBB6520474.1 WD40 repeat protein [Pseudoteredinibacter isoporae]NHO86041.1 hypothetical protein [Pseudoteredinibacter isoporae]NIB25508.1 hypothetical protein [Pseudoteredinibacter isoporae]